jgi:hypothetical protein
MPFAYYARLRPAQQRIYRRSDEVRAVPLKEAAALWPLVGVLAGALAAGERGPTQASAQVLLDRLAAMLGVPPVRAEVLAVRPSRHWGELHGLYTPAERGGRARITLWMQTAQRRRVVAFRTFFRTLVHELCHHLDYELLKLSESFHTEGFYRRESSLVQQLLGQSPGRVSVPPPGRARAAADQPAAALGPASLPEIETSEVERGSH